MASKVFTETMNKLNPEDSRSSITIIDNYIRYMTERIEFSVKGVFKAASEAGNSSAEVLQAVRTLRDTVSILSSTVSRIQGELIAAQAAIVLLQGDMVTAKANITALQTTTGTLQTQYSDLDARVKTLEEAAKPEEQGE